MSHCQLMQVQALSEHLDGSEDSSSRAKEKLVASVLAHARVLPFGSCGVRRHYLFSLLLSSPQYSLLGLSS